MAQTVHLKLKANGKDVKGESTQTSMGREGTIECISYEESVSAAREAGTNMVTGRRQHLPIKIVKRIDSASPCPWVPMTTAVAPGGTAPGSC